MKKVLLVLLVVSVAFLFATESRVMSMGGVQGFIDDNTDVFLYPGTIINYSGQVVSELRMKGVDNSYTVGLHLPKGSSVFGVYLNSPIGNYFDIPNTIGEGEFGSDLFGNVVLTNAMELIYGTQLNGYDFGTRFTYAADKDTDEWIAQDNNGDDFKMEQNEGTYLLGLGIGLSNETIDFGMSFDLPGVSWEQKGDGDKTEELWSGFGLGFDLRNTMNHGETNIVTLIKFDVESSKHTLDTGVDGVQEYETEYSDMDMGIAFGASYRLSENNLVILGVEPFSMNTSKKTIEDNNDLNINGREISTRTINLPGIYAGVESQIKPWLTGRFGASQIYRSTTTITDPDEGSETEETNNFKDYALSFGLGFHFGNFTIDGIVNEGLFFDGPNFISGSNEPISTRISLTYDFE
jgi:hypothetical protein